MIINVSVSSFSFLSDSVVVTGMARGLAFSERSGVVNIFYCGMDGLTSLDRIDSDRSL